MFSFKVDKDCCSSCSCCFKCRTGDNGSSCLTPVFMFVSMSVSMFVFIPPVTCLVMFDEIGSIKFEGTSSVTF
jgi:hypothetical protein